MLLGVRSRLRLLFATIRLRSVPLKSAVSRSLLQSRSTSHMFELGVSLRCVLVSAIGSIVAHTEKIRHCGLQGACVGAGVDLVSACDIRYCSEDAFFSIKEVCSLDTVLQSCIQCFAWKSIGRCGRFYPNW